MAESRLVVDNRYSNGVALALQIKNDPDRSMHEIITKIREIADELREQDPRFLYREFFADVNIDLQPTQSPE